MPINKDDPREISSQIVKNLGDTILPNERTLREQLTVDGFSLWDVMTPSMALYYVPFAMSASGSKNSQFRRLRPYISYSKHVLLNTITRIKSTMFKSTMFKNEDSAQPSSFFFMGFNSYMYNDALAPLAEHLASVDGKINIVLNDIVHSKNSNFDSHNIQFQSTWRYWDKDVAQDAQIFRSKVNQKVKELVRIFKIKGFSFDNEFSESIINHSFHWLLRFDVPLLVNQVVLARRITKLHNPSLFISPDVADIRSRVFTLVAKQEKIPMLELQYGSCEENSYEWSFLLADHIAVWGEQARKNFLKLGVLERQMTVTGTVRSDSLVNGDPLRVEKTKSQLDISDDPLVVLFASTYQQKEYDSFSAPELNNSMKKAIFNAANKVQGIRLIVKPHPLEDVTETRSFLSSEKNILFTPKIMEIRDLINTCDVFISLGTTATFDAMVAGKLIICPVFGSWQWSDYLVRSDATLVPRSESEIEEIFISLVEHSVKKIKSEYKSNQEKYISKMIYKPDGFSTRRISKLAIKLSN